MHEAIIGPVRLEVERTKIHSRSHGFHCTLVSGRQQNGTKVTGRLERETEAEVVCRNGRPPQKKNARYKPVEILQIVIRSTCKYGTSPTLIRSDLLHRKNYSDFPDTDCKLLHTQVTRLVTTIGTNGPFFSHLAYLIMTEIGSTIADEK